MVLLNFNKGWLLAYISLNSLIFPLLGKNVMFANPSDEFEKKFLEQILRLPKCNKAQKEKSTLPSSCSRELQKNDSFMHEVEDILQHECDLVDPLQGSDRRHNQINDGDVVDFVVVGSGTAGSIVAGRLATTAEQWKVVLLEAGGPYPTASMVPGSYFSYSVLNSTINWNFELEPDVNACLGWENARCRIPRGKVLGGTSVLHGMMYMRGNPYDYNRWAAEGNTGWGYQDVLPYFKMSEHNTGKGNIYSKEYHGQNGPVTVSHFKDRPKLSDKILAAAQEMGYSVGKDLNGKSQIGFTVAQATNFNGRRISLYNAYVEGVMAKHRNLIVNPYSHVTRILLNGTRAVGVEYMKNNQTYRVYARKEVIISAGTIQSPQLLMLSGIGPKQHLKDMDIPVVHDLPYVGQNLQNHVSYGVRFKRTILEADYLNHHSLFNYITKREGPMTSTGLSQITGFIRLNYTDRTPKDVPDMQIFFEGYLTGCSDDSGEKKTQHISISPTLLRPRSIGYVALRSSNPMDPPKIKANYFDEEEDLNMLIDGIKFAVKLSKTSALKDEIVLLGPGDRKCEGEFGTDEYWKCAVRNWNNPENHQTGTCRMGTRPDNSVVDPELRVHGIQNLRVIDASIMPHVVSGNVNAPIMMIAEKGAASIKKTWSYYG